MAQLAADAEPRVASGLTSAHTRSVKISIYTVAVAMSFPFAVIAAEPGQQPAAPRKPMSAAEIAAKLDEVGQGSALIRSKLEIQSGEEKRVLQLQIKQRRTKSGTNIIYQVLWPNERKGEAVGLSQGQGGPKGFIIIPQQKILRPIAASQMSDSLFDSDLTYQDAVENFFAWKKQTLGATEVVNGVNCQILESQPDNSSASIYGRVRSWIDLDRYVPLRIEKYSSSGQLMRRIDVTRVARDEKHHPIPASLSVHGSRKGSVSEFNGARIDQDVQFTDADFTPDGALKL